MSKVAVIYWSGTGNTASMANNVLAGLKEKGADAEIFEVSAAPKDLSAYDKIAFGCPSMGDEVLEEGDFDPYFTAVEGGLGGKKIALFGSYDWGDGQWMRDWQERVQKSGATLFDEGKIDQGEGDAGEFTSFGRDFADF